MRQEGSDTKTHSARSNISSTPASALGMRAFKMRTCILTTLNRWISWIPKGHSAH